MKIAPFWHTFFHAETFILEEDFNFLLVFPFGGWSIRASVWLGGANNSCKFGYSSDYYNYL